MPDEIIRNLFQIYCIKSKFDVSCKRGITLFWQTFKLLEMSHLTSTPLKQVHWYSEKYLPIGSWHRNDLTCKIDKLQV